MSEIFIVVSPNQNHAMKNFLLTLVTLFFIEHVTACSMYKITLNGKTVVGCNEDAWRTTPHIWFENATIPGTYGAAFTGSRFDGSNGYAPQSGMNEFGLCYSRLASHAPDNNSSITQNKKIITNPTVYLKDILHTCKTVDEVEAYISAYDHSFFLEDVMIYIEPSGKYLVVEPYTMTIGYDANYVLSNFCPSVTDQNEAMRIERYRKGVEFLNHKTETSLKFCSALSDTMHVCRPKIGDGTLLTSIWDSESGDVHIYFYHQYSDVLRFNVHDELAKGDHSLEIAGMFPANEEFEKLRNYKIPQNSKVMMAFLISSGILFFLTAFFFLIRYFRTRKLKEYNQLQLMLFPFGTILFFYMFILCTNMYIFYFPSPYVESQNQLITASSYLPYLLLLLIIPLFIISRKIHLQKAWSGFARWLFTVNTLVYFVLIGLFVYWGFLF